jgi:hypothetical protein
MELVINLKRNWVFALALIAVSSCAGWDDSKQLKDLDDAEKEALCNYVYDAWGGAPVTSFCTPEDDGRLVPIMVGQGERDEAVAHCLADTTQTRWVDCPTKDYVACVVEVEAESDVCVSQTATPCQTLSSCVAALAEAE